MSTSAQSGGPEPSSGASSAASPWSYPSSSSPAVSTITLVPTDSSSAFSAPTTTTTQPPPPPPAVVGPSNSSSSLTWSTSSSTSIGNYAASAGPASMSSAATSIGAGSVRTQPAVLAGIAVACVALFAGVCVVIILFARRSRRRRRETKGMVRITSRDDEKPSDRGGHIGHIENDAWGGATPIAAGTPASLGLDRVPRYTPVAPSFGRQLSEDILPSPQLSVPATLPSYTSRASRPSRRGTTHRESSVWEDGSEVDVLATDGSSTIRTISTYTDTTPTMTNGSSPVNTLVGTTSPVSANPFDHPGYTYPVGSSNAVRQARPQLVIDTSATPLSRLPQAAFTYDDQRSEFPARTRAENLRDEYMRSQLALNPFEDSAAVTDQDDQYRSPAWSHGNRLSRGVAELDSPWIGADMAHAAHGSDDEATRGRSRMVMPPTYSKLYPSVGTQ